MKQDITNNLPTARFSNELATKGRVNFTNAREWVIFLFLVAQLDPKNQGELTDAIVSVQDLERLLRTSEKKWGGLYNELRDCAERMGGVTCKFDTDVIIDGKTLPKVRPIFAEIDPFKTEDGTVFIKYCFNERMKPLLLGFKKNFLGIKPPIGINSGHAIRFLILAKAERDKKRKYERVTRLRYGVDELKALLSIPKKYKEFDNFRRRVINRIIEGVNKSNIVEIINFKKIRTGRKITHIEFEVKDSPEYKPYTQTLLDVSIDNLPSEKQLAKLTYAQLEAYNFLVDSEVIEGIAFRRILPMIPKDEVFVGYEDYFCQEAFDIIIEKSKSQSIGEKAAIFVDWFKKDIFKTHQYARIQEAVHQRKKILDIVTRDNREQAKKMTATAFRAWYHEQQEKGSSNPDKPSTTKGDVEQGLLDLRDGFDAS